MTEEEAKRLIAKIALATAFIVVAAAGLFTSCVIGFNG